MKFTKMESLGNDYIIIDNIKNDKNTLKENKSKLINLSNRNFGIGANGIIFIEKDNNYKIEIFNKDGILTKTSGNELLCVANYLYYKKLVKEKFNIEVSGKIYEVSLNIKNEKLEEVSINIGKPSFDPRLISLITEKNIFINEKMNILSKEYIVTGISIEKPYLIVFDKNIDLLDINNIGSYFQSYYRFHEKINIVFLENKINNLKTRIYNDGETISCGSAACAAVVAATLNHMNFKNKEINVEQKGGNLKVIYQNNDNLILKGNAKKVYKGKI